MSHFLTMLVLGLGGTTRDALHLFHHPKSLARALISMNGIMVVLATVMATVFPFRPEVKVALVALAVSPLPPILPERALKSGSKENYTIGLLVASALCAVVLVPLSMEVLQRVLGIPLRLSALAVLKIAVTTILLPLGIGMALHRLVPVISAPIARRTDEVAIFLLLVSVVPLTLLWRREILALVGNGTILALVLFCVIGLAVGHLLGRAERENQVALALSTATRHPAVALIISHTNFPEHERAPAALILFVGINAVVSACYLSWRKGFVPFGPRRHV